MFSILDDIDPTALFCTVHRDIELSATTAVERLMADGADLTYPPNCGFLPDEEAALKLIPKTDAMAGALRKLIASATASSIFGLLCLADGVTDAIELDDAGEADILPDELSLHDQFYESYWSWRARRPHADWRLDTYQD